MSHILPISVVIPTINRSATLKRTIDCLMTKEYIPSQVIVVDQSQNDRDRNLNMACMHGYKGLVEINYIYQETPSLTKARNKGFIYCRNDIIICSDDDVDVNEETLKNVYNIMQNENIAMIGAIDENSGSSKTDLGYLFITKSYKKRHIGHVTLSVLGRYPDNIKGKIETQWAMGYFFIIRKSLADKWNVRWDENLTSYAYAEDLDYSFTYYKKASEQNMRCILSDKVKVKHLVSTEYRVPSVKNTYMYVINREYLSYKHKMGVKSHLATRWTNFGRFLVRVLKREKPMDVLKAQWRCDRYRKLIKSGIIPEWLYI